MEQKQIMKLAQDSLLNTSREIERVSQYLDEASFTQLVKALMSCTSKVLVSGIGTSGAAARKIAHSLSCIDIPSMYLSPGDAAHGASGMIKPDDILILISKGGRSEEINKLVSIAHTRGAKAVAVTESKQNELAEMSDMVLVLCVERESDQAGILATASTLVVIAAFDAVCNVIMAEKGFSGKDFLTIHPGGDVGKKLKEQG